MFSRIITSAQLVSGVKASNSLLTTVISRLSQAACVSALLAMSGTAALAQAAPATIPPGPLPTDVTPIRIQQSKELFQPGPSLYLFQKLPSRLWFNINTEINQRYETNVFLSQHGHSGAYVFRAFPNITLGYTLFGNTSIYANYFVIKDVYTGTQHHRLTAPTTQSLGWGFRNVHQFDRKTSFQSDFFVRELWQQRGLRQADMIPGGLLTRVLNPHSIIFLNLQLQLRGHTMMIPNREIDPFYTVGFVYQKGPWQFAATDTFVTNFRNPPFVGSVPMHGNVAMIADFEINRLISRKIPNLVAFLRAEPIWNWHSGGTPSISGFDFRLYSGIRLTLVKPSYASTMHQLRNELIKNTGASATPPPGEATPTNTPGGSTPGGGTPGGGFSAPSGGMAPDAPKEGESPQQTSMLPPVHQSAPVQEVSLDSADRGTPTVTDDMLPLRTPLSPGGMMY